MFTTLIFLVLFIAFSTRLTDLNKENREQAIYEVLDLVVDEVEVASTVKDGYRRKFTIPNSIFGNNYTINITGNRLLEIKYDAIVYPKYLPTYVMGGFCFSGAEEYGGYELAVTKDRGIVSLSSCFNCSYSYAMCANAEANGLCAFTDSISPGFNESCCRGHCRCCPY